ncbi:hypothetical protein [Actinocorallia sp. A-T 12471]|nr:hypothetical protein [Actinocorallia sp. A-T 12471]MDX6742821.1 hypothetical protein [Actinocorallia sp. A-T 12471]
MSAYARWKDIRAEHVERAGGEAAIAEGKRQLLAEALTHDSNNKDTTTTT